MQHECIIYSFRSTTLLDSAKHRLFIAYIRMLHTLPKVNMVVSFLVLILKVYRCTNGCLVNLSSQIGVVVQCMVLLCL